MSLQRDVLEPAGVSNGSFYHQFRDKTDLLVAVLEDGRDRGRSVVQEAIVESADAGPIDRTRRRIEVWLEILELGEDIFRIQVRERENEDDRVRELVLAVRAGSTALLADGLSAALAGRSADLDAHRASLFIIELMEAVALRHLDLPRAERAAERGALANDLASFIVGGVATMAGMMTPQKEVTR